MIRFSRYNPPDQQQEEQAFLKELLSGSIPAQTKMTRPVALRSTTEQRRLAFRAFLQRTWVDHALERIERLLVGAVVLVFGFWLLNTYGYDWLYEHGYLSHLHPPVAATATSFGYPRTPGDYWQAQAGTAAPAPDQGHTHASSLPFTTPGMNVPAASGPDYLAPQAISVAPEPADRRPARLTIPAIQLDTPVREVFVEDGIWQVADYAAGYHHGSALPGDPQGNTVMAGHAGLRGSVFRDLGALKPADPVFVEAGNWQYQYHVRQLVHALPTQVELMEQTSTPVLTLITCTDWDTRRLVVIADLVASRPIQER